MALMRQTELDFGLTIDAGPLARSRARFTRTVSGLHALNRWPPGHLLRLPAWELGPRFVGPRSTIGHKTFILKFGYSMRQLSNPKSVAGRHRDFIPLLTPRASPKPHEKLVQRSVTGHER